jgi:hypothetical protein
MINIKPLTMLSHLVVVKLYPIIIYPNFEKSKSTYNILLEE